MPRIELIVDEDNLNERLDTFLSENTELSRSQIQKLIESGDVLLNGETCNKKTKTSLNDHIIFNYDNKTLTDILNTSRTRLATTSMQLTLWMMTADI